MIRFVFLLMMGLEIGCSVPHVNDAEHIDASSVRVALEGKLQSAASAAVAYNLGNLSYHNNDRPQAIAYWRRAKWSAPRDSDIAHNLTIARLEINDSLQPVAEPLLWLTWISPGELSIMAILLSVIGSGMALMRSQLRLVGGIGAVFGAIGGIISIQGVWALSLGLGVIRNDQTIVRVDPFSEAPVKYQLPAGTEVKILSTSGAYTAIEDGEGKTGWVVDSALVHVKL